MESILFIFVLISLLMKKASNFSDLYLLVLRLSIAIFMAHHGWGKLEKLMAGDLSFTDPIGLGEPISLALVVFSEFFCSILLGLGLFTRWSSIMLIITMAVAAFITHAGDPLGDKEMALMYLLIYIGILLSGAGSYSVDHSIKGKLRSKWWLL